MVSGAAVVPAAPVVLDAEPAAAPERTGSPRVVVTGAPEAPAEAGRGATVMDCTTPLPGWYGNVCVAGVEAPAAAGRLAVVGVLPQPANTSAASRETGRAVRIIRNLLIGKAIRR
jgi:hypothetical protein